MRARSSWIATCLLLLSMVAHAIPPEVAKLELQPLQAPAARTLTGRISVVVIWASWCDVCERSLPGYMRIGQQFKGKGVDFLAVSADDEKEDGLAAVKERKYGVTTYWADKEKVKAALKITGVPTVLVYDGDAVVLRFDGEGPDAEKKLQTTLTQLTSKK